MPDPTDLGDELNRLLSGVQDWARRALPEPGARADHPVECPVWCPICQFAHVLRTEHPEMVERLAEAGTALAGAIRTLSDAVAARAQPTPGDRTRPKPPPPVERIRLDDPTEPA